jgi:acyl-CoA reductase-like NAD-dependent aldehyde dehydrogenase
MSSRDSLANDVTRQMGRPRSQSDETARLKQATDRLIIDGQIACATRHIKGDDRTQRFVQYDPLGTVLSICPWNYPVAMTAGLIMAPLLAGNCVLFKHAPQTALVADYFVRAFREAGVPPGVFQALDMTHEDADQILNDGLVDAVQFIGSTRGGREVQQAAGDALIRVGLELGGKDPAYVRADADLALAATEIAAATFGNAGQSCCAVERLYLHDRIYDAFLDQFTAAANEYVLGDPFVDTTTVGPVVSAAAADRIRQDVLEALDMGAQSILEEERSEIARHGTAYVEPQILINVNHSMRLMTEETFGPILGVMRVADDEEALVLMDDSRYGLTASVWTADLKQGLALGQQLSSGTFYVNRADHADLNLPWCGARQSGLGCSGSLEGFANLTRSRAFHVREIRK